MSESAVGADWAGGVVGVEVVCSLPYLLFGSAAHPSSSGCNVPEVYLGIDWVCRSLRSTPDPVDLLPNFRLLQSHYPDDSAGVVPAETVGSMRLRSLQTDRKTWQNSRDPL